VKKNFILSMLAIVFYFGFIYISCNTLGDENEGYVIGDTGPSGGIVFYDKGRITNGWRYLEAAPQDLEGSYKWASSGKETTALIHVQGAVIGTGKRNTNDILEYDTNAPAAKACVDYNLNGYNDWFLPSKDELNLMLTNLVALGCYFNTTGDDSSWYWSSTDSNSEDNNGRKQVWSQNFGSTYQDRIWKERNQLVRPVRAF